MKTRSPSRKTFVGALKITGIKRSLQAVMKRLHKPVYEKRLTELVRCITPRLRANDLVLDVGCGMGALGSALVHSPACPPGIRVRGLERIKRTGSLIPMDIYDGIKMPYPDNTYDVVIIADVLHHEQEPERLFWECVRVSKRLIVIKDHQVAGLFGHQRVSFLDWAANYADEVPCIFRYNTPAQWADFHRRHGLTLIEERCSMDLYPPGLNLIFGRRLQYLAIVLTGETTVVVPPR